MDEPSEKAKQAEEALRKAYLHLGFGHIDEALNACQRAAELVPNHPLPPALEGSMLTAVGRTREALGKLRGVMKRFPDEVLPALFFVETCFLEGRARQAKRTLDRVRTMDGAEAHRTFIEELDGLWEQVDDEDVPPPLRVPEPAGQPG